MTFIGWCQIALFGAVVVALVKPLGWYMTRVFAGEWTPLTPYCARSRPCCIAQLVSIQSRNSIG